MKKNKIEIDILLFMLIEAFFLLYFFQVNFLNYLIGSILGIGIIFLSKKININKPINFFLFISSCLLLFFTIKEVNLFIFLNILRNYSPTIIMLSFLLLAFFLANKGYHTYIKSLEIGAYFFLFIKIFSFFLILPNLDLHNFNLSLFNELKISYDFFFITITYLYLHLSIIYLTKSQNHLLGFTISSLNPLIIKLLSILVLGQTLTNIYYYPYVNYLKTIKYFDFIERMEGILSFEYLFSFYFLSSFIMLIILTIMKGLFSKKISINTRNN